MKCVSAAFFLFFCSLEFAVLSPRIRILSQPVRGHVHPRETVSADQAARGHHQGRPIIYPLQDTHRESHIYSFCSWHDWLSLSLSESLSWRSGFQTDGLNGGGKPNTEVAHKVSVCVFVCVNVLGFEWSSSRSKQIEVNEKGPFSPFTPHSYLTVFSLPQTLRGKETPTPWVHRWPAARRLNRCGRSLNLLPERFLYFLWKRWCHILTRTNQNQNQTAVGGLFGQ